MRLTQTDPDLRGDRKVGSVAVRLRLLLVLVAVAVAAAVVIPRWLHGQAAKGQASGAAGDLGAAPVRHLAFTWLPTGYRTWEYRIDANRESLSAVPDPGAQVDQNLSVQVTAYQPGTVPPPDPRDPHPRWTDGTLDQRINHSPTQWAVPPAGSATGEVWLRWQYTPGGWAVLDYSGPDAADSLATAMRVGAATRFDRATPVQLPVQPAPLPPALRLQAIDGHDPGPPDRWAATVTYATTGRPVDPNTPYQALTIDVQAMNDDLRAAMDDEVMGATTTLEGHPARRDLQQQPGDNYLDQLRVWNVAGLYLAVNISGQQVYDLLGTDAVGVYHRLHARPTPVRT